MTPRTRRRLTETLRWVGALSALVAVLVLFRAPLVHGALPGLDRALAAAGLDQALQLGPAPGFQLRATSVPPGGELWVDGESTSRLPVLTNVICRSGQEVELEVRLQGYRTWQRTVGCRQGGQLEVTARLERTP
ncbi:MAG: PEGA domain-containing protein [Thermoanaerobaculia bacterium]|nr:PEGA domain-containing protein [Thermoanaerobaculia bacterium]